MNAQAQQKHHRLPTMYDLPSDDPTEPGLPDEFHLHQPRLLRDTFRPDNYPIEQIFNAANMYLYYDPAHYLWYKRPDWFGVLGVQRFYHGHDLRNSYVTWDEQVNPYLIVELLSEGQEAEDLGLAVRTPEQPPDKWSVYEQWLKIPYYVIYSHHDQEMRYFQLENGRYQRVYPETGYLWLEQAGIGIGVWQGEYEGFDIQWLRFCDADGNWLPTPVELAEQQAVYEQRQAEYERQQAERERRQAEQALQQVELERQRADEAEAELARLHASLKRQSNVDDVDD